jgi:hypothetical protein
MRTQRLIGSLLVVLGVFLLVVFQTGVGGEAVPLLVPGGILTGLGAGIVVAAGGGPDASVVLGLGLGFVAVYVISLATRDRLAHWWPLIPGGILALVGISAMPATEGLAAYVAPIALILAGAALLAGVGGRRSARPRP